MAEIGGLTYPLNISLGNDLLPSGNNPVPEPILTEISKVYPGTIGGSVILVPCYMGGQFSAFVWNLGTDTWNLRVPDLLIICSDFTLQDDHPGNDMAHQYGEASEVNLFCAK